MQNKQETVVLVTKLGHGKYVAMTSDHQDITSEIPTNILRRVADTGYVLNKITTKTGKTQWRKRNYEDFPPSCDEDKSFGALMNVGWFAYGRIVAPPDGRGQTGAIQFTDENGIPLQQNIPSLINTANHAGAEEVLLVDQLCYRRLLIIMMSMVM